MIFGETEFGFRAMSTGLYTQAEPVAMAAEAAVEAKAYYICHGRADLAGTATVIARSHYITHAAVDIAADGLLGNPPYSLELDFVAGQYLEVDNPGQTLMPTRLRPGFAALTASADAYARGHLLAAGGAFLAGDAILRPTGGSFLHTLVNDPRITRIYTAEIEYWGRL